MKGDIIDRISGFKVEIKGRGDDGCLILGEEVPLEKAQEED